jgi:hypothetical protein
MDQKAFTPVNPLAKHFRTPAIYLKLPSQGSYWTQGSLNIPANGEIPVLPMTTRDEIILRTPDALLNGQGVINAIESCCPSITDAWQMPSIDVDALVIAIRIASYGNSMEFSSQCPHCGEESDYEIDLSIVLDNITAPDYNDKVKLDGLTIKLKPQSYENLNKSNMISFEEQQILRTLGEMQETDRTEAQHRFNQHLNNLISMQIDSLTASTDYIELESETRVTQSEFIDEFYKNCDNKVINSIKEKLQNFVDTSKIKPVPVNCHACDGQFNVAIEFEWSSFFASGS